MNKPSKKITPWLNAYARDGQLLVNHANNVSSLAAKFGKKCGIREIMRLAGFLHDLGKATQEFQEKLKGKTHNKIVEHSVYGGKRAFVNTATYPPVAEVLANIIAAHHGQLYDNISPLGETPLCDKINSAELLPLPHDLAIPAFDINRLKMEMSSVIAKLDDEDKAFGLSMLTKLAYSCLVDADRLDAYLHEVQQPYNPITADWLGLIHNLTRYLEVKNKNSNSEMAVFRRNISDRCEEAGLRARGVYKLEVPTGGGKTLSSLRFALNHAKQHGLDRIIYVIPYLSILSQTAIEIRQALSADEFTVLEHHSGFLPEDKQEDEIQYKLHSDRWDAPIILTTQVQFLESIFSARGSDLRKLHNMANSVFIFDEAQSVPVASVHLFNGAINFLNSVCGSTVLMCTATQPLLDKVSRKLRFTNNPSLVQCGTLSKRTKIINATKPGGHTYPELATFVKDKLAQSTLVIVNTKIAAKSLYDELKSDNPGVLHLSTNMCGAHRDDILAELRLRLKSGVPAICVSTQLIEAGVDISLECVVRVIAGLDSIYQAAGRCNRHGEFGEVKNVYVVDIAEENLSKLPDIEEGAKITRWLFNEGLDDDINTYYQHYFHARKGIMDYPIPSGGTVYDLLSCNNLGHKNYASRKDKQGVKAPIVNNPRP